MAEVQDLDMPPLALNRIVEGFNVDPVHSDALENWNVDVFLPPGIDRFLNLFDDVGTPSILCDIYLKTLK
jgi:hypothetical protein